MVTILIIDDDEDDRDLLTMAIQDIDASIKCIMARNGEEALQILGRLYLKPHLIFLDLNMPFRNGVQFIKELRKNRDLQDIPVVIYTTSSSKGYTEDLKNLGAMHFITKPHSFKDLSQRVQEVFTKELIRL
jgi:CheY-like chemotaxis protein